MDLRVATLDERPDLAPLLDDLGGLWPEFMTKTTVGALYYRVATTEYPQFLSAVQAAANDSGVSLSAWTPREKVPEKYYARVPMKLELTGRFLQIARFFHNVGQLDRIINMENISMTDPRNVDDEVVLKAEALATAFHVIEPADGAGDDKGKGRKRNGKGGK